MFDRTKGVRLGVLIGQVYPTWSGCRTKLRVNSVFDVQSLSDLCLLSHNKGFKQCFVGQHSYDLVPCRTRVIRQHWVIVQEVYDNMVLSYKSYPTTFQHLWIFDSAIQQKSKLTFWLFWSLTFLSWLSKSKFALFQGCFSLIKRSFQVQIFYSSQYKMSKPHVITNPTTVRYVNLYLKFRDENATLKQEPDNLMKKSIPVFCKRSWFRKDFWSWNKDCES